MKVGILTWFYGANYGAKAQAFALQELVREMGHEPCMINYLSSSYSIINLKMNLFGKKRLLNSILNSLIRCRKLQKANAMYNISAKVHNALEIDALGLDCIILGSDAIFNLNHPLFNEIYYGVGISTSKITFSPSCESLSPNVILSNSIISSLKEMKAISVRDDSTKNLIKNNAGIESIITLDPTMLYDFQLQVNSANEEYMLVYTFSEWNECGMLFRDYAKKKGLKIVAVGRDCCWADNSIINPSFFEWIESFQKADIIITDSFHGTVFSIKNKKEFVILPRKNKTEKITSLMKEINIMKEFYNGECDIDEYIENNSINYEEVIERYDIEINKSKIFLKDAIEKCLK